MKCVMPTLDRTQLDPEVLRISTNLTRVPMWVLRQTADGLVARLWTSRPASDPTKYTLNGSTRDAIEDVLFGISDHWRWVARAPEDDPSIVGVWL